MAGQAPCLGRAAEEVLHGYVWELEVLHADEADEVQHQRSRLVEEILQSVPAPVAAVAAAHEDMEHHMDWQEFVAVDCCDVCSYLDDHTVHQLVEERRVQPAYHLGPHQRALHCASRMPMLLVHQIVPSAAPRESVPHNRWQYEQRRPHQGQQGIARLTVAGMHLKH